MTHWSEAYLPRRYAEGAYDCADLVADVQRERFGREVVLPSRALGVRGRDEQMRAMATAYARRADEPAEGDLVLMRAAGRRSDIGHHVGVLCLVDGRAHVLHCRPVGTCLHPLDELERHGVELVGTYAWR